MDPNKALGGLPATIRAELLTALGEIVRNFRERRWEPSELNGGKLCEIVYTILRGHVDGTIPVHAAKPQNMVDACRALEKADDKRFPRSVRIQIPRLLVALYEVRNNRGVGHVGGDVNPNAMDARLVLESSKWLVAELVRVFHNLSTDDAVKVVDSLVERTIAVVWDVGPRKRVLQSDLSLREQTLLLLYSAPGPVSEEDLVAWVEPSSAAAYRRDVLRKAHIARLIEYDSAKAMVHLSPKGVEYVEAELSLELVLK